METFGAVRKATYVFLEEGQEKESVVFWQVVVRDSSSSYEGKSLSAIFVEREMGCGNVNAVDASPLHRSSPLTFLVAPLQRKMMNQNQMKTAGFVFYIVVFVAQNLQLPFCPPCLLQIPTILLF